jgi:hypothetical protein
VLSFEEDESLVEIMEEEDISFVTLIRHKCKAKTILDFQKLSQPHFEGGVRGPLTLPKMGLESPPGLPKIQSSIVGVKTPCLEVFFIPLERS